MTHAIERRGALPINLSEIGEFGLISRITARLPQASPVLLGPGDDAAVLAVPDGRVVVTTDLLVQDRHFRLEWMTAYDVGRRAAAASLADVAAMGAVATAIVVGLAAPPQWPVAEAEALATGLSEECACVGASVVGGDVVRCDRVMVAVTALGDLAGRAPVTRAGTRPGDVVVAAGRLGWASAGLRLLGEGQREGSLVDAYRRPAPPYRIAAELARLGASAMVDVSDGLLADLGHVADASGVRIDIELGRARSLAAPGVTDDDVLTGGDDHAIVAAIAHDTPLPDGVVMLGRVRPGSGVRVDGAARPGRAGHDHFREGRP